MTADTAVAEAEAQQILRTCTGRVCAASWCDGPAARRRGRQRVGRRRAAVVLAAAVAAGGAAIGTGAGSAARPGGGSGSTSSTKARDRDAGPVPRRLADEAVDVGIPGVEADDDCVDHSYGAVRLWFRDHPCDALFRTAVQVDVTGGTVLVAVSWVDVPTEEQARGLHDLVDGDGTGTVTELSRERGPSTGVRFTGEHYASARDGTTVLDAQAQAVAGEVSDAELASLARGALR